MKIATDRPDAKILSGRKVCFKCNTEKPLSDYYKHKEMADGHLNKCKSCTKADTKSRADLLKSDSAWIEKERKRHRGKYHRLEYKSKHKPAPEVATQYSAAHRAKYPEKYAARALSQHIKPLAKGTHLHHWSYRPEDAKDVIELSPSDHYTIHRFIEYDQAEMMYRKKYDGKLLDTREKHQAWIDKVLSSTDEIILLEPIVTYGNAA
ncbi:hypothetical protein [Hymenobacter glacieicola]|uniref:Uncharacterized protein n=1 Tax=Hymenobacter glacieicola TaxID=1562124 RepID=A0ABQ1X927_9BACT|nr:hypothetical protein [Hymenobacter glacieicola]GGG61379.1 hypothetical protein GCM10011378_41780 [Hymenobacter glacieicola]